MSRGRKPKLEESGLTWKQMFYKNAGLYLQNIISGLSTLEYTSDDSVLQLLEKVTEERGALIKKEKKLPPIRAEEIPFSIPENWVWCRLGEITQHNSGKTLDGGRNKGEPRDCITTSNLYWGHFELTNLKQILITDSELSSCTAHRGDLLICEGGEAGRAAIWRSDASVCFQNHIHRVRPYGNINSNFIYRYFQYLDQSGEINKYRKGMGISNLSGKALSLITFPLPPLVMQGEIVDFLNDLENNNLKESNCYFNDQVEQRIISLHKSQLKGSEISAEFTHQLSLVKKLRQQLLQDAIQGKLVKQNPKDHPASELLMKIKAEKGKLIAEEKLKKEKELQPIKSEEIPFKIPENWVWCRLGELLNIKSGKRIHASDYRLNGIPFLRSGEIGSLGRGENLKTELFISDIKYQETKKKFGIPKPGDILIACIGGSIGNTWIVDEREFYFKDGNLVLLESIPELIVNYSLSYLKSPFFWKDTIMNATDSSYNALTIIKLNVAKFPLPPVAEQIRIVQKLNELMHYCNDLEISIKQSALQNEKLLQQVLREALSKHKNN